MDAEWFQGGGCQLESSSIDAVAWDEPADGYEILVPQHWIYYDMMEGGHKPGEGNAASNLLWPVVEIVEMSLPEVFDDEWPDSDDRDGIGGSNG